MRASDPKSEGRILLMADDRRFRALACTLLTRRGYTVSVCVRGADLAEAAVREGAHVVVIDASASLTAAAREAARLGALDPPVAIVAVSADEHPGLVALPVIPKWSPFEALFSAIERARAAIATDERARAAIAPAERAQPAIAIDERARAATPTDDVTNVCLTC